MADGATPRHGLRAAAAWPVRHVKTLLHWALVLAALGYIGGQLPGLVRAVREAEEVLAQVRQGWLLLAVLLAVAALVLYGELHRRVPVVGGAGALAYSISRLRRRGVDAALASWSVFLPGALASVLLLGLGVLALGAAGWLPLWLAVAAAAAVAVGAAGAWAVVTHPAVLRRFLVVLVHIGRRLPWLCRGCRSAWASDPDGTAARLAARIGLLHPAPGQWTGLVVLSLLSWAADFLALVACSTAVGLPAHWTALALGFLAVQVSIALQILPGGAGLAETGLLGVLLAAGAPAAPAAATVLLYRMITWLGLSVVGWIVYAAQIHLAPPHRHRHAPEPLAGTP
jgi:uncharacterized membrane protein YbhN (UPF0104 family)